MKEINIKDIVGEHCSERNSNGNIIGGKEIRQMIESFWNSEQKISISFKNIKTITPSFIDEAIGKLALKYDFSELQSKLEFKNYTELIKARINKVIFLRNSQRKNNNTSSKIASSQ